MDKTTSGFKVRKNKHQVIHQNQWCFIPNNTHWLLFVPQVNFTQFKSNPELWIKQPVIFYDEKNNQQVIHQKRWCFIPNNTHRFVFGTAGGFYTI